MSVNSYTIREYQPGDEHGILALLNEVFAEENSDYQPRTLAEWRWEYEQNPAGREVIVATEASGRVVAHYACLPARAVMAGESVHCGQGVDSMVAAEYRRGLKSEGLFLRTARRYFDLYGVPEHNAYGYGFPNAKALRVGIRMLAYQPVHAPVLTLGYNLFEHPAPSRAEGEAGEDGSILALESMDEQVDRLWERTAKDIRLGIVRDRSYLTWRYLDCPRADYKAFGLTDGAGGLRGLMVTRANWTGPPILALCELLVPDSDQVAVQALVQHAVAAARRTGQQRVEVWCRPGSPQSETVQRCGFKTEHSPFSLCIKPYRDDLDADWARQHWYFSIGDADVF